MSSPKNKSAVQSVMRKMDMKQNGLRRFLSRYSPLFFTKVPQKGLAFLRRR